MPARRAQRPEPSAVGLAATSAVVTSIVLTIIAEEPYLVDGLTAGSVK